MYDDIAEFYHLIFPDWDASIQRQGAQLAEIIRSTWGGTSRRLLDVTCGIGTQAIGLAQRGFDVTASDLSEKAIERARVEAALRNIDITFEICDVRDAADQHGPGFDVVISCDNSIPHLLTDDEIRAALRQMYECAHPGGGALITLRDYADRKEHDNPLIPYGVRTEGTKRYVVFQTRAFDGDYCDVALYFIEETDPPVTHVGRSRYYMVGMDRVSDLMHQVGFEDIHRIDHAYYQPVLVGTRHLR